MFRVWAVVLSLGAMSAVPVTAQDRDLASSLPFTVDEVIHPAIARLPPPDFFKEIEALPMVITARNETAQRHVVQGMSLINAGWDFEAYRHFCEAVRADRDCLMAYWGIGLALAAPNNEFTPQRVNAISRMVDLIEAEAGTALERDYALALASMYASGAKSSAREFSLLARRYPNNLQAKLLAAYLGRGGYDEFGEATVAQEEAIENMRLYLNLHPDNLAVLTFWAVLHAESPDAIEMLTRQVLPFARKIARLAPEFPPYQHLLGHFEWRCGNHRLAEAAFARAADLYAAHMKKHKLTFHDCDGWVRTRLYHAAALYSQGRFDEAMKIAKEMAALQIDEKRFGSPGADLVLWEARTLPARLYAARGWEADFDAGIASLPAKDDPQLFRERTMSIFYLEAMRQYLGSRRELHRGNRKLAGDFRTALSKTGVLLLNAQEKATRSSAISEYVRALRCLEALSAELRGLVALAADGSERRSAFNWFKSAVSKQQRPTMLMPPPTLYPMEIRLGEYHLRMDEPQKAAEAYWEGLTRRPNDLASLSGYERALAGLGRTDDAARIAKQIRLVKGN
ncbi:MAG: hypothetical protein HKN82_09085 [Akkermansiaceae bacterium]|nr:hypothetical protein [Akkermansiaceae bacterium]NNM31101.1 hypothetical protein [Akkermansiaceae bacterium]